MRNILVIFICIVILASLCVPVSAKENYDVTVEISNSVIWCDDGDSEFGNINVSMYLPALEKYEYCTVYLDYNTDIIRYVTGVEQPVDVYRESQGPTETGMKFYVSWNDKGYDRADGWNYGSYCNLSAFAEGIPDFKVRVQAKDVSGKTVELNVKFDAPYNRIVNKSELEFIELGDALNQAYGTVYCDHGTTVGELLENVSPESAVIKNKNGEILADSDSVPNSARIVTLFNGYDADSVSVCVPYDVDSNGKITASDARLALRYSAYLESYSVLSYNAADVDGRSGVTASDARQILRKAAGL